MEFNPAFSNKICPEMTGVIYNEQFLSDVTMKTYFTWMSVLSMGVKDDVFHSVTQVYSKKGNPSAPNRS